MNRIRPIVVWVMLMTMGTLALSEHLARRGAERQAADAVTAHATLRAQVAAAFLDVEQLKSDLTLEHHRSAVLARQLSERSSALEQALARLLAEERTVERLTRQLASMGREIEALQSELAVAIEMRPTGSGGEVVALDRVVVGAAGEAGPEGRVVSVHPEWRFVIVDLGWDQVRIGDLVAISRQDERLATARIERVQEDLAAATLLPDSDEVTIQVNDVARVL